MLNKQLAQLKVRDEVVKRARLQIKIVETIRRIDRLILATNNVKRLKRLMLARRILVSIDEGRFEVWMHE